jgi:PAS domain-containing protein
MTFFESPLFNLFVQVILILAAAGVGYWFKRKEKAEDIEHKYHQSLIENGEGIYTATIRSLQEQLESMRNEMRMQSKAYQAELKAVEAELREMTNQVNTLKTTIMTMKVFGHDGPFPMWAKDRSGRRSWHNPEYEMLTGYKLNDCLLKTDLEITGNQEIADAWSANDDEVIRKGAYIWSIEPCAHRDRPDDIFQVLVIKWPRRINDQVIGVDGAAHRLDEILPIINNSEGVQSV